LHLLIHVQVFELLSPSRDLASCIAVRSQTDPPAAALSFKRVVILPGKHQTIAHLEEGEPMSKFRVLINDNAHYMDESERSADGVFANADEAIAACKAIVDDELNTMWKPGTTANELYELYIAFGPDPFVVPLNPKDPEVEFSAWTYAKEQCQELVSLRR
jgi:hypothetical protein